VTQQSPSGRALSAELAGHARLVEIGVGRRPGVARALARQGCDVAAVDVDIATSVRDAAAHDSAPGTVRPIAADVTELAAAAADGAVPDALRADGDAREWDAVYARNLPAEIQRPTVELADRLDAACRFTTLGFEEPIVPVRRLSTAEGVTVYAAGSGPESRGV